MEITIKGNPEEITKLLQTIASSQEQRKKFVVKIEDGIHKRIRI